MRIESLEQRALLSVSPVGGPVTAAYAPLDVNHDNAVTALDALVIINQLNTHGPTALSPSGNKPAAAAASLPAGTTASTTSAAASPLLPYMDVNTDGVVSAIDALIVINRLNAAVTPVVQYRLQTTDTVGNPISQVSVGQDYELRVFVKDVRDPPQAQAGVFAGFTDVTFDSALTTVDGTIDHAATYTNGPSGDTSTPGLLNEVGGITTSFTPLGNAERLLFKVLMKATAAGTETFVADPADVTPEDFTLLYDPTTPVTNDEIAFGSTSIEVVAGPSISIADKSATAATSGNTPMQFALTLSQSSNQPVTVSYATAPDTAIDGVDYQGASGSLTFQPGETTNTVTVQVLANTLSEPDKQFFLNLSGPAGATLADAQAIGTIHSSVPLPALSISGGSIPEGNGGTTPLNFTVTLSAASGQAISVAYATVAGTAQAGVDYQSANGTLTFAAGEASKTITILVNGNKLDEADKTFQVALSAPTGATLGTAEATGTIVNDDSAPSISIGDATLSEPAGGTASMVFNVSLSAPSGLPVTVSYATASGTALEGTQFQAASGTLTFAPGDTTKTIAVPIVNDNQDLGDQTLVVNLSSAVNATLADAQATGTIIDRVANKLARIRLVTADLNGNPISQVEGGQSYLLEGFVQDLRDNADGVYAAFLDVNYDSQLATVLGPITFGTNYPNAQAGDFSTDGEIDEVGAIANLITNPGGGIDFLGPDEQILFSVPVKSLTAGTVAFGALPATDLPAHLVLLFGQDEPVESGDVQYLGTSITVTPPSVISVADTSVQERDSGLTAMTFTLTIAPGNTHPVTVDYATAGQTATPDVDYQSTSGTLTFAPGETSKTVTVEVIGDKLNEPDESLLLKLSNPAGGVIGTTQAVGTIQNDDPPPTITTQDAPLATEGISDALFTVKLSAPSGLPITVAYATASQSATSGADFQGNSGTLTFVPGETSKAVTVPVIADPIAEGTETFALNLSNPTNAVLGTTQAIGRIQDMPVSSLSGYVYADISNEGVKQSSEPGLGGVTVSLSGTTIKGASISLTQTTAADGSYHFTNLLPGIYTIVEAQPLALADGRDTLGSLGGNASVNDAFTIVVGLGVNGVNYNFGEGGLKPGFLGLDNFFASSLNGRLF